MSAPAVSVVVPYFENQRGLDRLLAALALQEPPEGGMEVVVSDDGSAVPPFLPRLPFRCTVVRQENLGFRAAAARNLGARSSTGEVVVFLDGDMIPEPGFLIALLAGVRDADDGHGALAVGARHHADLSGCNVPAVVEWITTGSAPGARRLEDPQWLAQGYERTADLSRAGREDFRLVISALLAVDRRLFERCGGFDESLVGYGGEDWDLAYRCWQLGARLRHVPAARAWHDGPDLAGRGTSRAVKDAETLALAQRIPLPSTRGAGVVFEQPWVVVRVHGHDDDAEAYLSAAHLLRDTDAGIWFVDREGVPAALAADPRVHVGEPPREILDRAVHLAEVHAPLRLDVPLRVWCEEGESEVPGLLDVRDLRAVRRGESSPVRRTASGAGVADPGVTESGVTDPGAPVHAADTTTRLEDRVGHAR